MDGLSKPHQTKNEKGFTLIELIVVCLIIVALAAIFIPQLNHYKIQMYHSVTKASLHDIYLACKAYWLDNPDSNPCNIKAIEKNSYSYTQPINVVVTVISGKQNSFKAMAKHNSSNKVFIINELGDVD